MFSKIRGMDLGKHDVQIEAGVSLKHPPEPYCALI
ncbi:hypothetical protein BSS2_I0262 [Brucella suis bv. 1 str. S2]|uniref:Uncharacterized protein n=2 Tax=Brucella TaxID=234 RepID=A0A0H3G9W7_BRUSU|nr:hypothetical protein BR0266 [Brucella suis 1330]ACU47284.1 hypothetical protein BMI_I271 [Brucella microti CCM 4915]AEK53608.1 hypothetical protein BPI_I300 [Brucella pinnipedialis B2/94]AEU05296.1 hypothetical protein BSVBI22_A0267 [Brucella suis VBI22]AHN45924.1 hypothetical protein BSS2_I0262 [Brucella suis bv. 1 str. S2]EFM58800.1 Hypothetical protein BIBO2_2238 [Brucella sp. BO2]EFM61051.1 Hypothetical protein BROD_3032 [Brucella sp. NF 2653]CDL75681.1 unnamed protein product [Brucel